MENVIEKREHRRLDIRLPLEFNHTDVGRGNTWRTITINVSTGGVYFETTIDDFGIGDQLALSIGVDPRDQRFPPEGKISTIAEVVRISPVEDLPGSDDALILRYGIGAKFRQPLKLSF